MGKLPHFPDVTSDPISVAIRHSRQIFLDCVWPLWANELGSARVVSTEDSERPLERCADMSGTDAFFIHHTSSVLVPIASRIEFFDESTNNPFNPNYWSHYPRFTIRLAKRRPDGSLNTNVECRKRLLALEDPISRRYLPLYTFQSLVRRSSFGFEVVQTSRVNTESLFRYVREKGLADLRKGNPSKTRAEDDIYRIVTAAKLTRAGISVITKDYRMELAPGYSDVTF